jgi:hypothetical protein
MRAADGSAELERRVAELDGDPLGDDPASPPGLPARQAIIRDAGHFIRVLDEVTMAGDHAATGIVSSAEADAIVARSLLIGRLGSAEPALATGGIDGCPQFWVATGKPPWAPPGQPVLSPEHFVAATQPGRADNVNPFGVGLYTSSGFQGTQGMWRLYLEIGDYSSNTPHPWHVWRAEVSAAARVRDVTTAAGWEELTLRYPAVHDDGLIYPDWPAVAGDWDAVHLTIRAIAAIQGLRIRTPRGFLAPSYWDVETTFWLRWAFPEVKPVAVVELSEVRLA